ncbi:hypothetical protein MFLAVUS_008028 [Mucor flavus]|uniref:F-box domain-containing protein n=1 Tax=Mucor flavus TaxID=439312 RepID=A0ABP9Z635_9FUNG
MIQLPFEILQLIFIQLTDRDLLQCQLTCKRWNQVSVELLYSNIKMKKIHKYYEYTCTIKNSPRLAKYLKCIVVGRPLVNQFGEKYDLNDLLSTVVENCPNLLKLQGVEPNYSIWTRLIYAANQGKLLRLQCLPKPTNDCIESYVYAALSFKKTLHSLVLCGQQSYYLLGKINYSTSYQIIFDSINEFTNLQELVVGHYTDQLLSYWDAWIDNCRSLKSLTVSLFYTTQQEPIKLDRELDRLILQSSNIQILNCHWEIIKCDEQLKYIMHKFPKLQDLKVICDPHLENGQKRSSNNLSFGIMIEFLQYASTIPKINIGFDINKEYLIDIFTKPKKLATSIETVLIKYSDSDQNQDMWICRLLDDSFEMEFVLNENITELPHISFLSKVGNRIRSLKIEYKYDGWGQLPGFSIYNNILGDSWVYQALQLCPQLQEFTLRDPVELAEQTDITFQHVELKSFSISEVEINSSLKFLERLSSNAPNLSRLHLTYTEESRKKMYQVIRINMPFTSFNLITWNCKDLDSNSRYIVKLNTILEERFFFCKRDRMLPIDKQTYVQLAGILCFDITCRKLDEFRIVFTNRSTSEIYKTRKWNF